MRTILLNVDAGELVDEPNELVGLAHVVHIACGGHAGDAETMRSTLRRAKSAGTRVGAHPSYPDRDGFGRRPMSIGFDELRASLTNQVNALARLAGDEGLTITSLKPHGALYHAANEDRALAVLLIDIAKNALASPMTVVGPPSGCLQTATIDHGLMFLAEGFADRRYEADGSLRARSQAGALLDTVEEAALQARTLASSGRYGTLCVHGDSPHALSILAALRVLFP